MKRLLILLFYVALSAACNPKIPKSLLTHTNEDCEKFISNRRETAHCLPSCFMEKMGVFVNGEMQPEKMLNVMGPISGFDKVKNAQNHCDWIKGNTKCDTAWEVNKCYFQLGVRIVIIVPNANILG